MPRSMQSAIDLTTSPNPLIITLHKPALHFALETALYFVSTENSRLNIARVAKRVKEGGHPVPIDKIIARYRRSMSNLAPACLHVDEAVLFDNSSSHMRVVARFLQVDSAPPAFTLYEPLPAWVFQWCREMADLLPRRHASPAPCRR